MMRSATIRWIPKLAPSSSRFCSGSKKFKHIPNEVHAYYFDPAKIPPPPEITLDMVNHLERQSLVRFSDSEAIQHLQKAITFADQLQAVDTTGIEPMVSPCEDLDLITREDVPDPAPRQEILANAAVTADDYFVAPPGNVPLEEREEEVK